MRINSPVLQTILFCSLMVKVCLIVRTNKCCSSVPQVWSSKCLEITLSMCIDNLLCASEKHLSIKRIKNVLNKSMKTFFPNKRQKKIMPQFFLCSLKHTLKQLENMTSISRLLKKPSFQTHSFSSLKKKELTAGSDEKKKKKKKKQHHPAAIRTWVFRMLVGCSNY